MVHTHQLTVYPCIRYVYIAWIYAENTDVNATNMMKETAVSQVHANGLNTPPDILVTAPGSVAACSGTIDSHGRSLLRGLTVCLSTQVLHCAFCTFCTRFIQSMHGARVILIAMTIQSKPP